MVWDGISEESNHSVLCNNDTFGVKAIRLQCMQESILWLTVANYSYLQHFWKSPRPPLASPLALPNKIMSSLLDGSCALTAQMNILAAMEKSKTGL